MHKRAMASREGSPVTDAQVAQRTTEAPVR